LKESAIFFSMSNDFSLSQIIDIPLLVGRKFSSSVYVGRDLSGNGEDEDEDACSFLAILALRAPVLASLCRCRRSSSLSSGQTTSNIAYIITIITAKPSKGEPKIVDISTS
jgi:hypothetical protein